MFPFNPPNNEGKLESNRWGQDVNTLLWDWCFHQNIGVLNHGRDKVCWGLMEPTCPEGQKRLFGWKLAGWRGLSTRIDGGRGFQQHCSRWDTWHHLRVASASGITCTAPGSMESSGTHLKCLNTNTQSMRNKQDELEALVSSQSYNITGICMNW